MNSQQKGFSTVAILIVLVLIVVGIIGYFAIVQRGSTPTPTPQGQITNWEEYRWGPLKFKYPADWKVEAKLTSIILTPPAQASTFLISPAQAASVDSIIIDVGGEKSCVTLGQNYHCTTAFGLPIYTASNDTQIITVFEEVTESVSLSVSSRDVETGMEIGDEMYTVNNKTYTAEELNAYLKTAPAGRYDIAAQAGGYRTMSSYFVLPVSQVSSFRFMMGPLEQPPELSDSYLQQFTKPGTGLLVGYVVDEDGQPLEGVAVSSPVYSAATNNRGFYALNVTIPASESCAGVDVTFAKSGYKTEKHLHAMSGSVAPRPAGGDYSALWDTKMNITLLKGSGENVTDDKHKLCP